MTQNIGNRLVQAIVRQGDKSGYFCSAENISANQKVHELRRGFKRLRALLRFFREVPDTPAIHLQQEIRNFGKLLAPLRESAVNVDLFDREIAGNELIPEKKIRHAHDLMVQKNRELLDRGYYANNLHHTIQDLFSDFKNHFTEPAEWPSKQQLYNEVKSSYQKSYTCFEELPATPHAEEWHTLRKKLKRLWYQLDFIRFLHPRYIKLKSDQLNKITDQLGDDHDLHVFIEDFLTSGYGFSEEEKEIMKNQAERLRELNQRKLQPRLKQFFTAPPEEFDQKLIRFFKL
jgi:CHAD domain-containing protein